MEADLKKLTMLLCSPEGPVEIGMSLDIASIDAISEINMVYLFLNIFQQCVNEEMKAIWIKAFFFFLLSGLHSNYIPSSAVERFQACVSWK